MRSFVWKELLFFMILCFAVMAFAACGNNETAGGNPTNAVEGKDGKNNPSEEGNVPSSEGLNYLSNFDGTCAVTGIGTCTDTDIVIPAVSPSGDSVTSIYRQAFFNCSSIESVTIPASVTEIGDNAFGFDANDYGGDQPMNLARVVFCDNSRLTSIGPDAFKDCKKLERVTFGANSRLERIETGAFRNCSSLTEIEIPASTAYIGEEAFFWCGKLAAVTFGANSCLTTIESSVFEGCGSLASVEIPAATVNIKSKAFQWCISLTSVTFAENCRLTSIGDNAFYFCTMLTSIEIPSGVTSIGVTAFGLCYRLVEVYNQSSLTITKGSNTNGYVADHAKEVYTEPYVSKLSVDENGYIIYTDDGKNVLIAYTGTESVLTLPENITEINAYAFSDCSKLVNVEIPVGVTSIGDSAFNHCTSLVKLTYKGTSVQWSAIEKGTNWDYNTGDYTVHCEGEDAEG